MPEDFLDPKQIIKNHLKPLPNMTAADFGCGSGGWSIPLAEILDSGKVYAIDILDEPLSALRSKLRSGRLFNIEIMKMDVEKTILRLLGNSVHIVLISNLLFQVNDKKKVLEEAKRILKPDGKILVIDWEKDSPVGPETRVAAEEVRSLADGLGLIFEDSFKAGSHHYGLILKKAGESGSSNINNFK